MVFEFSYQESDLKSVKGIDVYVTEDYGSRLYDSCKDVKYSLPNVRAMDFVGGGANNYTGQDPAPLFPALHCSGSPCLFTMHPDTCVPKSANVVECFSMLGCLFTSTL
jgi:Niemann-Pick C1 protein